MGKGIVHKAGIRAFALAMFCTSMQYLIGWFAVVNSVPKMTALLHQVNNLFLFYYYFFL